MEKGVWSMKYGVRNIVLLVFILTAYFLLPTSTNAQSVDLLWEGDGYTPPFYEGRALWSKQSTVHLVAIPNGLGNASALNYRWIKNGTVLGSVSGRGRNTLFFEDTIISRPQNITVEVYSGSRVLAESTVLLSPVNPSLSVYEDSPLYGFMFHREVSNLYQLEEKEVTFAAFPLFFSIMGERGANLDFLWRSNTGGTESGSSVTYRIPEGATGVSQINVGVSNRDKISQSAEKGFFVEFK